MNCKKFRINLNAYLDNAAQQHEKMLMGLHLQACAKCAKKYSELKNAKRLLSYLDKQFAKTNLENQVINSIKNNIFSQNPLEFFVATAKTTLIAAVFIFGVIVTFNFLTPSLNAYSGIDNVDAMNNYVLKGNIFAKQSKLSDAKIMQALLG